ncbi:MAG: zinc dependent phospholipase C family protein [Candidatus Latescibacteria bacterium]|nr:zinc dependent phospholipase C family protein [Candidatus Latescibacterota bacterium]
MPGISTHINFSRIVLERIEISFDNKCFVLGSIAPDSANALQDDRAFQTHHFILTHTMSDLKFFLDITQKNRRQKNLTERSFIGGYYSHLWLDCFTLTQDEELKIAGSPVEFKENVRNYDMLAIKDFVKNIKEPHTQISGIPVLNFLSISAIMKLWGEFIDTLDEFRENKSMIIALDRETYNQFLIKAANAFIKDLHRNF